MFNEYMFITVPDTMGDLSGIYVHPMLIESLIEILGLNDFTKSITDSSY